MTRTARKDPQLEYAALAAPVFDMNTLDLPPMVPACLTHTPHLLYGTYHFVQSSKTDRATLPVDSPDTKILSPKTSPASPSTPSSPKLLSLPSTRQQAAFSAAVLQEDLDTVAALFSPGSPGIAQDEEHAIGLKLQGDITVNSVINASGSIVLHILAARGNPKGVSLLVESGPILDLPDKAGETPLLKAAYGGHAEVVKYLINHDANVLQRDTDGWTALRNARAIVDESGDGLDGLEKLEKAIQILLRGIKGDTNSTGQKATAELIQTALRTAENLTDRIPTIREGKQAVAGRRTVRFQVLPDDVDNPVVQDVHSFDRVIVKDSRTQASPPENEAHSFDLPERVIPFDPFQRVKRVDLKTQSAPPDSEEVADALDDRSYGERTTSSTMSRRTSSASARSILQRLSSPPPRPSSHNIATPRRSLSSSPRSTVVPDSTSRPQSPQTRSPPTRTVCWSPTYNSCSRLSSRSNSESMTRPEDLLEPLEDEIASANSENQVCPSQPIEFEESRFANLPERGVDEEIHASLPNLEQPSPIPHSPKISDTPPPLPPYPSHLDGHGGSTVTSPATQAVDIPNHHDGDHTESEIDEFSLTQATPRPRISGGETPRQSDPVGHDQGGESSARSDSSLRDQRTTATPSSVSVVDANIGSNTPVSRIPSHVGTASAARSTPDSPAINRVAALIQMIPPSPTSPLAGRMLSPGPLSYRMTPQSEWQPDDDAPDCTQCARHFNLFLRRHHCRWCGLVYCDRCTGGRVQLVSSDYAPQRVCDSCFHFVTGSNTPLRFLPLVTSVPNIPLVVNHVGVAATIGSTSTSIARTLDWGSTAGPTGPSRIPLTAGPRLSQSPPGMLLFGRSRSGVGSSGLFSHDYDDTGNADSGDDDSDEQGGGKGDDESIRTRGSMVDSIMNECPVCGTNLDTFAEEEDRAEHVNNCLLRVGVGGGKGQVIKGDRYIVQTLKAAMDETECAICFEDFEIGQRIARLNCLCLYHEHCIEGWFATQVANTGVRSCPVHFK
ncbi:hypothetical protein BJ742DRAFT_821975 [Cladochytrium replicatum]|nr:hypothetical protein BJ742DRAFT_821975 [Cladochytrium replicatum]